MAVTRAKREREARRVEIVAAAEAAMCRKGYHEVSMDEIARESGFTKRTLYQYFRSKEDLYFAVAARALGGVGEWAEAEMAKGGNASERLRGFLRAFLSFFKADPGRVRIFTFISQLGRRDEGGPNYLEWKAAMDRSFSRIAELVGEGVADGSMRKDLDPGRTALSLVFLVTGFLDLLAGNGASFTTRYGMDFDAFAASTMDMLADSIARSGRGRG
jgi:AcrR family transcriptional regulator